MSENPYESPQGQTEATVAESRLREQARASFRLSAWVLFLPAFYNYWAFDTQVVSRGPDAFAYSWRAASILAFLVGGALVWYLGLPTLDAIAGLLRRIFARGADRVAWEEALHRSLLRLTYLALPGAALWLIWVFGFYQMRIDFYAISWAVGIPAHLLGACWYVPLIYQWYRLARPQSGFSTTRN